MHAEGKKATQTSKAADNEREGVLYLNPPSEAITCSQFEIRLLFKIEASSFFEHASSLRETCDKAKINCSDNLSKLFHVCTPGSTWSTQPGG